MKTSQRHADLLLVSAECVQRDISVLLAQAFPVLASPAHTQTPPDKVCVYLVQPGSFAQAELQTLLPLLALQVISACKARLMRPSIPVPVERSVPGLESNAWPTVLHAPPASSVAELDLPLRLATARRVGIVAKAQRQLYRLLRMAANVLWASSVLQEPLRQSTAQAGCTAINQDLVSRPVLAMKDTFAQVDHRHVNNHLAHQVISAPRKALVRRRVHRELSSRCRFLLTNRHANLVRLATRASDRALHNPMLTALRGTSASPGRRAQHPPKVSARKVTFVRRNPPSRDAVIRAHTKTETGHQCAKHVRRDSSVTIAYRRSSFTVKTPSVLLGISVQMAHAMPCSTPVCRERSATTQVSRAPLSARRVKKDSTVTVRAFHRQPENVQLASRVRRGRIDRHPQSIFARKATSVQTAAFFHSRVHVELSQIDWGTGDRDGCQPCAPGHYCDDATANAGLQRNCSAGFVCLGGAYVPTPTDNVTGYPCPRGNFCPAGTLLPLLCLEGTFSNQTGLAECFSCPARHVCPTRGTVIPASCPAGRYCPAGSNTTIATIGLPCPPGTFSNTTGLRHPSECLLCTPGSFCNSSGLDQPTGPCFPGFHCPLGSTSPTQHICPPGSFCLSGTPVPTPCPPGTFASYGGLRSQSGCRPCSPGQYCFSSGQSNTTGPCAAGYYCPQLSAINVSKPDSFRCPRGHYCPEGSAQPVGCPPATYSPVEGRASCLPCPAGFYCVAKEFSPTECPAYSFCTNGSSQPTLCPDGSYTLDNTTELESADQCLPCVVGSYCQQGRIVGDCNPGYHCRLSNPSPTPSGENETIGGPCPVGFYCPAGTVVPQRCPGGLFISYKGATGVSDCSLCPAGMVCPLESSVAIPCRSGHYCPYNSSEIPCPIGTFNNITGAPNDTYCLPCEAGFWCRSEGMSTYEYEPCPVGHYCDAGVKAPTACPVGTFRNTTGAAGVGDCYLCPAGYFCSPDNETIFAVKCPNGTYCPAGSWFTVPCDAGFYCPDAADRIVCPPQYYCPAESTAPIACPFGHYCAGYSCNDTTNDTTGGASVATICPLGYQSLSRFPTFQTSFQDTCVPCEAGTYGAHPERRSCTPCRAGVVCLETATTDEPSTNDTDLGFPNTRSYLCPPGYYCPDNTTKPVPCPAGTYLSTTGGQNSSQCTPCPVNFYQHLTGQAACLSCGADASSTNIGSAICVCQGTGRVFQVWRCC